MSLAASPGGLNHVDSDHPVERLVVLCHDASNGKWRWTFVFAYLRPARDPVEMADELDRHGRVEVHICRSVMLVVVASNLVWWRGFHRRAVGYEEHLLLEWMRAWRDVLPALIDALEDVDGLHWQMK